MVDVCYNPQQGGMSSNVFGPSRRNFLLFEKIVVNFAAGTEGAHFCLTRVANHPCPPYPGTLELSKSNIDIGLDKLEQTSFQYRCFLCDVLCSSASVLFSLWS